MANNTNEKLFSQFPPVSTEQWEEVIKADLKGADYEKKLVWRTAEGFNVRPYYRAEDLAGIEYLGKGAGEFPFVRGNRCRNNWKVHETIPVTSPEEANVMARKATAAGAESIGFRLCEELSADQVAKLVEGIDLGSVEVVLSGKKVRKAMEALLSAADKAGVDPEKFRAMSLIDPIVRKLSLCGEFECSKDGSTCFSTLAQLVKDNGKYKKARFVTVSGEEFHNSGSTIVQELAFTLAAGHEYLVKLMEAGLKVDQAAKAIRFSMAVSSNYFMEIAKFRAGRLLWANIVNSYNPESSCAAKMFVHAVTSQWNLSVYDPYVNMLRGTTEAMSASLAGVHSLEVMPFNAAYEAPTEFSSRIARNVQLLLKHESHFDNVVDPAGGSYYIENLTKSIADQAWKLFRQVEDKGGYIAAFQDGYIVDEVTASAEAKDKAIATRRQVLLGTNQYPNVTEIADKAVTEKAVRPAGCSADSKGDEGEPCTCGDDCDCKNGGTCTCGKKVLRPYRGGMAFEQLRLHVDRSGKSPKAFMLTCGTLSMARARSQFACNFFACAGIRVEDNTFFKSVEEGAEAALKSGAEIVVICAADDDYAELAPKAKQIIGDKAIIVVAGGPASQPELEKAGISHCVSARSNVLETLKGYVNELGL